MHIYNLSDVLRPEGGVMQPKEQDRKAQTPTREPTDPVADDLRRINRVLRTLRAGHRTLLRAADEQNLLQEMTRVIVDEGGYRMAWVGYAQADDAKTIRPMAHAGYVAGFFDIGHFTWADTEWGQGPAGLAIRTGKPCIGRMTQSDPAMASWREESAKRGYGAVSVFPLIIEGDVIGNLSINAAEADAFDENEVALLTELAEDLAYGIANLRTRLKRQEAEQTVARMAFYDSLTGLPNRVLLHQRLGEAIATAKQHHWPLALLSIGIEHFREINDTLGNHQGDLLLQEVATRLARGLAQGEILARVADNEFALLLPHAGADYATRMGQRLAATLYEPVELAGLLLDTRAAIGAALFPGHGGDPNELIRRANVAMWRARHASGGFSLYSGGLDQERGRRLALLADLRRAIDNDELLLFAQPKVHMASRRVCGAEALVRWQHPQHGMISTAEFVRLAEDAGLITPLTHWVLEAAFNQRHAWHEADLELPLAVNLSARDLRNPRLVDHIRGLFATWGTFPNWMEFEITESALMEDPSGALDTLKQLKDLGVRILVDDFGTGYSSLRYLQSMPVDTIKIDQSFVIQMDSDADSQIIVHSTIELGHSLGLDLVAEGVETAPVWQRLCELGCDAAQGYFISKPIPAPEFREWERQSVWHC